MIWSISNNEYPFIYFWYHIWSWRVWNLWFLDSPDIDDYSSHNLKYFIYRNDGYELGMPCYGLKFEHLPSFAEIHVSGRVDPSGEHIRAEHTIFGVRQRSVLVIDEVYKRWLSRFQHT